MRRIVTNGIRSRKLRAALTALSIVLGVAMISGTFVLTGQISRGFDAIFAQADKGTDAVVLPHARFGGDTGGAGNPVTLYLPQSLVTRAASAPGAAKAVGTMNQNGYLDVGGTVYKPEGGAPAILSSTDGKPFESSELVRGHFPSASGEVAVDQALADRSHVKIGQHVTVATDSGLHPVTVSAIVKFPGLGRRRHLHAGPPARHAGLVRPARQGDRGRRRGEAGRQPVAARRQRPPPRRGGPASG